MRALQLAVGACAAAGAAGFIGRFAPRVAAPHTCGARWASSVRMSTAAPVKTHEVFMPALSSTMTEGKIVQWLKNVGDKVDVGDAVMVVESDKADMDVESFEAGYLAAVLVPEGGTANVGATVALIAESEADIAAVQSMGLSSNIPSGDGSRHDGTTAVNIEKIGSANPSHELSTAEAPAAAAPLVPEGVDYSEVFMPALSSTMTEGKIVQWLKGVGDKVSVGESVMVVESDKADMDVESFEDGYVAKILVEEGGSALVGAACAVLVANEADIGKVGSAPAAPAAIAAAPAAAAAPATAAPFGGAPAKPDVSMSEVFMPALSSTMTEGKVVQWLKSKGDKVSVGDAVLVVESDKADMDVESFEDGYLAAVLTGEGEAAAVGAAIALLATSEADIATVAAYGEALKSGGGPPAAPAAPAAAAAAPAASSASAAAPARSGRAPAGPNGRIVASGYAKKLAKEWGVDLSTVSGTGPNNRVTASDVEAAKARGPSAAVAAPKAAAPAAPAASSWTPAPGVVAATPSAKALAKSKNLDISKVKGTGNFGRVTEADVKAALGMAPAKEEAAAATAAAAASTREVPQLPDGAKKMDAMQNAVAKNMDATLSIPVFRVSRKIRTDGFDDLYRQLKPRGVTVSAMLAKAVALVLEKHPIMNAKYAPGQIVYQKDINVAMAVAIEGGLLTPTLRNANVHNLLALSQQWKGLVAKAKDRKLSPQENAGGTFVITNLGMYGVSEFAAILPPNTGSILAIGGSLPVVAPRPDGSLGVFKEMTVTITCDHRHIYGADAAEFLRDLADLLENNLAQLLL